MINLAKSEGRKFWDSDLEDFESQFLGGRKITELMVRGEDGRVPCQGSVRLFKTRNVDDIVIMPGYFSRLVCRVRHCFK